MTEAELRLFAEAVHWYGKYCDSNPDVGMGASWKGLIDDVSRNVGVKPNENEVAAITRMATVLKKGKA